MSYAYAFGDVARTRLRALAGDDDERCLVVLTTVLTIVLARRDGSRSVAIASVHDARRACELLLQQTLRAQLNYTVAALAQAVADTSATAVAVTTPGRLHDAAAAQDLVAAATTEAIHWSARAGAIAEPELRALSASVEAILRQCDDLDRAVDDLAFDIVPRALVAAVPPTACPSGTVVELFDRAAARGPDAVAVIDGAVALTYAQVRDASNALAAEVRRHYGDRPQLIAMVADRGWRAVVAMLGILRAGCAYLPLDPGLPSGLLRRRLADVGAQLVVDARALAMAPLEVEAIEVAVAEDGVAPPPHVDLSRAASAAYVMQTSGSTGRPKSVVVSHDAIVRLVSEAAYAPSPGGGVLHIAPLHFDASTFEVWFALCNGGRCVVHSESVPTPDALRETIARGGVTCVWMTTSLFNAVVDEAPQALASVEYLITGGEVMSPAHVARVRAAQPQILVVNAYGPTENTTFTTTHPIAQLPQGAQPVPIGTAIGGTSMQVRDVRGRLVPRGFVGELYLGGQGLALGYLGDAATTACKFVPDPEGPPGARAYRTGDQVRLDADGILHFVGRGDDQVKVRGFRIELGAIETVLSSHPALRGAVVTAEASASGPKLLHGYVVCDGELDTDAIEAHLREHLPEYMVPRSWTKVSAFPLTATGKVDRRALAELAAASRSEAGACGSPLESLVAAIWARALDVPEVGPESQFFALGGDSIRTLRILGELSRHGYTASVHDFFATPRLRDFCAALSVQPSVQAYTPFSLVDADERARLGATAVDAMPPSQLQAALVYHGEADRGMYHFVVGHRLRAAFDRDAFERAWSALADRHELLRARFDASGRRPLLVVEPAARSDARVWDLRGVAPWAQQRALDAFVADEHRAPIRWDGPRLYRLAVHHLDDGSFHVTLSFHHALADGWSVATLFSELVRAYRAAVAGEAIGFARVPLPYGAFVADERRTLASASAQTFWRDLLVGRAHVGLAATIDAAPCARAVDVDVPLDQWTAVRALARQWNLSPKTILLTVHLDLLARWAGTMVVSGVATNARPVADGAEDALGLFANVLPMWAEPAQGSWRESCARVARAERRAQTHRQYPLPQLVADIGAAPFDAVFNYLQFHVLDDVADVVERQHATGAGYGSFPLVVSWVVEDGARLRIEFDARVLDDAAVSTLAAAWRRRLAELTDGAAAASSVDELAALHTRWERRGCYALHEASAGRGDEVPATVAARSEPVIARLWQEVLDLPALPGQDAQFVKQGGHSLAALSLAVRIRNELGKHVGVGQVLGCGTLGALAAVVDDLPVQTVTASALPAATPARREATSLQRQMWFLHRWAPASRAYHVAAQYDVAGPLDVGALARAVRAVIDVHPPLRAHFEEVDGALWECADASHEGLRVVSPDELDDELMAPFDLGAGVPSRFLVASLSPSHHVVAIAVHHAVFDGWSSSVLWADLARAYEAAHAGRVPVLAPRAYGVAPVASSEPRDALARAARALAGRGDLELLSQHPRPAQFDDAGASVDVYVEASRVAALRAHCAAQDATLFVGLACAWAAVLARHASRSHFCLGTPMNVRGTADLDELIGCFVNTVPIAVDLGGDPTRAEALMRMRDACLDAHAWRDVPLGAIVDRLEIERDPSRNPVFQATLNVRDAATTAAAPALGDARLTVRDAVRTTAQFDLALDIHDDGEGLHCRLEYATALFDRAVAEQLVRDFAAMVRVLVVRPDESIWRAPDDGTAALAPANAAEPTELALAAIERGLDTDDVVLVDGPRSWTGRQLAGLARAWVDELAAAAAGAAGPVALIGARTAATCAGVLAVMQAGRAVVPVPVDVPARRARELLAALAPAVIAVVGDVRVPDGVGARRIVRLRDAVCARDRSDGDVVVRAEDAAYAIWTSGTTGTPKAVVVRHGALAAHVAAVVSSFSLRRGDRVLQFTDPSFDVALEEMLPTWAAGASVHVRWPSVLEDYDELARQLDTERITVVNLPTRYWQGWTAHLARHGRAVPASLRLVVAGGERIDGAALMQWRALARGGAVQWANGYGLTETTITSTLFVDDGRAVGVSAPTGSALAHARVYLLDRRLAPVSAHVGGELYIGGPGIAAGYAGQPGVTAASFVPDPFASEPGARMYKTGDLAIRDADGTLTMLGRADGQVKVRGHRIELGEVEHAVASSAGGAACAVVAVQGPAGMELVAYVQTDASLEAIARDVAQRLPAPMVPKRFERVDALPLQATGKVDRARLRRQPAVPAAAPATVPLTPTERAVAQVWSSVLGRDVASRRDNFFALGGDSILSLQVVSKARGRGIDLTTKDLFLYPSLAELAGAIDARQGAAVPPAEQGALTGPCAFTAAQRDFLELVDGNIHHWNQTFLFDADRPLDAGALQLAVAAVVAHHDALRLRLAADASSQAFVGDDDSADVRTIDLTGLEPDAAAAGLRAACERAQGSLDLHRGPVMAVRRIVMPGGGEKVLFVVHHFVVDAVSWSIILDDIHTAYAQLANGDAVALPAKTSSLRAWVEHVAAHAREHAEELPYWTQRGRVPLPTLPRDRWGRNDEASADTRSRVLPATMTRALLDSLAVRGIATDVAVIGALALALGETACRLDVEVHGRELTAHDIDLSRTVGWFTSVFPLTLRVPVHDTLDRALDDFAAQIAAVPARGANYLALRHEPSSARVLEQLPRAEMSFNFLGAIDDIASTKGMLAMAEESPGRERAADAHRWYLLEVCGAVLDGALHLGVMFSRNAHAPETIDRLLDRMVDALVSITDRCAAFSPENADELGAVLSELSDGEIK